MNFLLQGFGHKWWYCWICLCLIGCRRWWYCRVGFRKSSRACCTEQRASSSSWHHSTWNGQWSFQELWLGRFFVFVCICYTIVQCVDIFNSFTRVVRFLLCGDQQWSGLSLELLPVPSAVLIGQNFSRWDIMVYFCEREGDLWCGLSVFATILPTILYSGW